MNNDFKQKLQEREFLSLKNEHRVILKWATGCGKSKMTIDLLKHNLCSLPHGSQRVLFVVAERSHIKNWQEEFEKWKLNIAPYCITMVCYNSLHKVNTTYYDAVVLDEAHHAFTEKRMAALEEMKDNLMPSAYIYLLSATLSSGKQDMIEGIFGKFKTSTVTLKDAIEGDILPDPKVYVVEMQLDNVKKHQEIQIGNDPKAPVVKWEDRAKYIYKNVPCIIQCTEFQKNLFLTQSVDYWNERYHRSHSEFQRVKAANYGSQRKRFLGELKTGVIRKLIDRLPKNNRFVCFCASVAQANALDYVNTISSKRPAKSNQIIIDKFNNKQINHIYAVGMITEGMNLTDIQTGIIVQLDGKERLFIQKFGRSLRAEDPVTFIFYYKDTQDEKYLKGALENIDSKFVQYITIDQLKSIKL
jgi:superfamily II DNA or RNA helicase